MGYCPFCGLGMLALRQALGARLVRRQGRWACWRWARRAGSQAAGVAVGSGARGHGAGVRGRARGARTGEQDARTGAQGAAGKARTRGGARTGAGARGRRAGGRARQERAAGRPGRAWCTGWASLGLMQPVWVLTWGFD